MVDKEKKPEIKKVNRKFNMYCIHRLLWDSKLQGQPDKEIWADLKEMFQSADYNLSMELRPIEMLWGDTRGIDNIIRKQGEKNKTNGKTDPSR